LKSQLNDGIKCLEQRLDTQISILYELQDFFKKRAEVEAQYSRDLDKLTKQVLAKHKSEKTKQVNKLGIKKLNLLIRILLYFLNRRESWQFHSAFKLWEALINDTKQHSKYHQVAGEVCSKYVAEKFDEIIEDIKRIFSKVSI
jgi:SLIT-ROBO Rho GTPase activating protein